MGNALIPEALNFDHLLSLPEILPPVTFSELAEEHLKLAVLSKRHPDSYISIDNCKIILWVFVAFTRG